MAATGISTEYRCGYCYQGFESMTDPRELPCHHTFCLVCLKEDFRRNSHGSCPMCGAAIGSEDGLNMLPAVTLDVSRQEVKECCTTTLTCDCMDCGGQLAVCYCLQCFLKICTTHQQNHSAIFGASHEVISISVYENSPSKYNNVLCEVHKEKIIKGCDRCDKLVCNECDLGSGLCTDSTNSHSFSSLNQLREKIALEFKQLLKLASDKLTEICKLDKQLWQTLDTEGVRCESMLGMVEEVCEEQIKRITQETTKLKERIREYQRMLTNQVETYNSELMAQKEELEESRHKLHRCLQDDHVTERVIQRKQLTSGLQKNLTGLDYPLSSQPVLIPSAAERSFLSLHLEQLPTSLTLKCKHNTGSACYSVSHRGDGSMLVGQERFLELIRAGGEHSDRLLQLSNVNAAEHNGIVYISYINKQTCHLEVCLPDYARRHKLLNFLDRTGRKIFLAVSSQYVGVRNPCKNTVLIYGLDNKQTTTILPEVPPRCLCFLPDGDLLVTGYSFENPGVLMRFCIRDDEPTNIWTCEGVEDACGVCVSADGLIFVSSFSKKTIYIISPQGQILHTLTDKTLPVKAGQISIKDNEMAVPGFNENLVYAFKINY